MFGIRRWLSGLRSNQNSHRTRARLPAYEVAVFIEVHEETWAAVEALDKMFGLGAVVLDQGNRAYSARLAILYGAADSFGRARGFTSQDVLLGFTAHLHQYANWEDTFEDILNAFREPEHAGLVQAAGEAVYKLLTTERSPAEVYLPLHEKYLIFCRAE